MAVVAERLVAHCLTIPGTHVACNRSLHLERTKEGPVFENSGEMLLHQRHRRSW